MKLTINDEEEAQASTAPEGFEEFTKNLFSVLIQGYQSGDYIRVLMIDPELVEPTKEWVREQDFPETLTSLLEIVPGEEGVQVSQVTTQAQVELSWLRRHFMDHPIRDVLLKEDSPVLLSLSDFKQLYIMELWDKARTKGPGLWTP